MFAALFLLGCRPDTGPLLSHLLETLPESARIVQRVDGGRPVIVVIELLAGDPRGAGGSGGLSLLAAFAEHSEVFLRSGDGADVLLERVEPEHRTHVHLLPAGEDERLRSMRHFSGVVYGVETPLAGLRDMVLSRAAPQSALAQYTRLRESSFQRFDELSAELTSHSQLLVDVAMSEAGPVVLGVPALAARATATQLSLAGATFAVVRPAELAALPDGAMWWAGQRASLPPVLASEEGLPSFGAWLEALMPAAVAVSVWEDAEQVRKDIAVAVGQRPPELAADDPRRALLREAAQRLSGHPHPALGDPVVALESLVLCERPLEGTPMSYDPWFDVLKVDRWVQELPIELVAAVLAHELVHVRDLRVAASNLGTDLAGWSLIHDTLPPGVMRGVTFLAEDRAFRVENELVPALGVTLPLPEEGARILETESASQPERLRATLSQLRAAGPGTLSWMQQLARMVPTPR